MAQCTPKSFDLTGKVALITGASYGIGMAIAKAMAANGATIVFNDIKQELVDKGIAAYTEAGIKAHGYVCDVTDEDAVNAMVAKITEEVGHIKRFGSALCHNKVLLSKIVFYTAQIAAVLLCKARRIRLCRSALLLVYQSSILCRKCQGTFL